MPRCLRRIALSLLTLGLGRLHSERDPDQHGEWNDGRSGDCTQERVPETEQRIFFAIGHLQCVWSGIDFVQARWMVFLLIVN